MSYVTVVYHHEDGTWWAESPDVAGVTVVADEYEALRRQAHDAIEFMQEAGEPTILEVLSDSARRALQRPTNVWPNILWRQSPASESFVTNARYSTTPGAAPSRRGALTR